MSKDSLEQLRIKLISFFKERGWEGEVHSPKNLSMSLVSESAELMQHFRWVTSQNSCALPATALEEIEDEIGDVLINLVALSDQCGIDPVQAAWKKLEKIAKRYPHPQEPYQENPS